MECSQILQHWGEYAGSCTLATAPDWPSTAPDGASAACTVSGGACGRRQAEAAHMSQQDVQTAGLLSGRPQALLATPQGSPCSLPAPTCRSHSLQRTSAQRLTTWRSHAQAAKVCTHARLQAHKPALKSTPVVTADHSPGECGKGPNIRLMPSALQVGHIGTPARLRQLVSEVCGLEVPASLLQVKQGPQAVVLAHQCGMQPLRLCAGDRAEARRRGRSTGGQPESCSAPVQ